MFPSQQETDSRHPFGDLCGAGVRDSLLRAARSDRDRAARHTARAHPRTSQSGALSRRRLRATQAHVFCLVCSAVCAELALCLPTLSAALLIPSWLVALLTRPSLLQ
eukprot:4960647-Pleurochrysis_carterae.AAC.3